MAKRGEARVKPACVCVCHGISGPCRPCTAWWSCRGGNAVKAAGCQLHILPTRLLVCATDEEGLFFFSPHASLFFTDITDHPGKLVY